MPNPNSLQHLNVMRDRPFSDWFGRTNGDMHGSLRSIQPGPMRGSRIQFQIEPRRAQFQPTSCQHLAPLFEYFSIGILSRGPVRHQPAVPKMPSATRVGYGRTRTTKKGHEDGAICATKIKCNVESLAP